MWQVFTVRRCCFHAITMSCISREKRHDFVSDLSPKTPKSSKKIKVEVFNKCKPTTFLENFYKIVFYFSFTFKITSPDNNFFQRKIQKTITLSIKGLKQTLTFSFPRPYGTANCRIKITYVIGFIFAKCSYKVKFQRDITNLVIYRWTWIWQTTVWQIFAYDGRFTWSQSDAYQVFVICIWRILHMTDQFSWSHWGRHIQVHL